MLAAISGEPRSTPGFRESAANLKLRKARLRDEIKRLKSVELAVMDDPTVRQSAIESPEASWPKPGPRQRPGSRGGNPGTRGFKKKGR